MTVQGSVDVDCSGAQSSSGSSAELDGSTTSSPSPSPTSSPEVSPQPSGGPNTTAIVAGVVVPVVVILILLATWLLLRRRKRNTKQTETARSAVPYGSELGHNKGSGDDALEGYHSHSLILNEEPGSDGKFLLHFPIICILIKMRTVVAIGSQTGKHSGIRERFQASDPSHSPLFASTSSSSTPTYPPAGQSQIIPPTKSQQAGFHTENLGSDSAISPSSPPGGSDSTERPRRASSSQPTAPTEPTRRPSEQVFQHTDVADTEMVELPPPYVGDRPVLDLGTNA